MKIIAVLLFAATLSACATHGAKFDSAKVDTFQPGITTVEEVTAALGKPYSTNDMGKNGKLLQWIYTGIGGSSHVAILFRPDGTMERVATRSGK
jgi:hypothetical protein